MHYLLSLQRILAARSKNVVFLQNILLLLSPFSLSLPVCLDLWKHFSQSRDFFIPVSLSLSLALVFTLCPFHFYLFYFSPPPSLSPTHSHALFCSVSGLWCFSYTRNITLTLSLCLPRTCPDTRVHFHSLSTHPTPLACGSLPVRHPSTSVSLSPPLTSLASLWSHQSPSQSPCHSSQLLSSHREKERNVFTPCWSTVISPPVWNDSLVTHSLIGNSL